MWSASSSSMRTLPADRRELDGAARELPLGRESRCPGSLARSPAFDSCLSSLSDADDVLAALDSSDLAGAFSSPFSALASVFGSASSAFASRLGSALASAGASALGGAAASEALAFSSAFAASVLGASAVVDAPLFSSAFASPAAVAVGSAGGAIELEPPLSGATESRPVSVETGPLSGGSDAREEGGIEPGFDEGEAPGRNDWGFRFFLAPDLLLLMLLIFPTTREPGWCRAAAANVSAYRLGFVNPNSVVRGVDVGQPAGLKG